MRSRSVWMAVLVLCCGWPVAAFALDDTPTTPYLAPAREEVHAPPQEPPRAPAKQAAEKSRRKK